MLSSTLKESIPQDLVAIFHTSFHPTQGNVIDWSLKASDDLDLTHVEFSCLPSGLHLVERDIIYFTKGEHQGVCVFRRRRTSEDGHRGFRLSSLGILLAKSSRPRPWRHVPSLKTVTETIYSLLEDRDILEPSDADWDPARAFFEERKVRRPDLNGAGDWNGWSAELDGAESSTFEASPTLHLPHMLRILGPSSLTLYKHVLGRQRVLIYTAPPVEAACVLCQVAADVCYDDQYEDVPTDSTSPPHTRSPSSSTSSHERRELRRRLKKKSKDGVKVLGMITLNDIDKLQAESATGRGWIACTTDAIYLEKPTYYDLVIDLTTASSSGSKLSRPTMYVPRPISQPGSRGPTHRLSVIRFTWSDVKLWTELDRLMRLDSGNPDPSCCDPSPPDLYPRTRPGLGAAWSDMWRVYEDVCVLCAGLWIGSWRNPASSSSSSPDGRSENWGSIRLEGDDYLSLRSEADNTYVRNVGMGIEGRPSGSSETGVLHHRISRHMRRTSGMSMWTWASGKNSASIPKDDMIDEGEIVDPDLKGLNERQLMTTLAILHAFHKNTTTLLLRLAQLLPPAPSTDGDTSNSALEDTPPPIVLTAKDVLLFELGPLSSLDQRFVEWLAAEYGGGAQLVVRRSWRDLMGLVLGL
ncbi:hypothetical protein EIP91_009181 [Steccherinum ochraceum]|uniref:Protein LCHN n=1 Tax=Steccherinum ochraceum TaxID=92696 RepID=A0A4R0R1Y2_9APHY|nr:hypothetical protein EIP91_009181 [Steccherinum ochraceum]